LAVCLSESTLSNLNRFSIVIRNQGYLTIAGEGRVRISSNVSGISASL
jgi:hypothetical protein